MPCHADQVRRLPLVLAMLCVLGLSAPASGASAAPVYCKLNPTFSVPQVIWVDGSGSSQTTRLCARVSPGRYVVQRGPFVGHVGRNGVAAPGAKREGDGKTPYGSYPMRGGFGIYANPGLASSWLVTNSRAVWVDDSDPCFTTRINEPRSTAGGPRRRRCARQPSCANASGRRPLKPPIIPGSLRTGS